MKQHVQEIDPPVVAGGQGRTAAEVTDSAVALTVLAIAGVLLLGGLAWLG